MLPFLNRTVRIIAYNSPKLYDVDAKIKLSAAAANVKATFLKITQSL